jgi:type II secretory pathway pseudopilin PulG
VTIATDRQPPTTRRNFAGTSRHAGFGLVGLLASLIVLGALVVVALNSFGPSTSNPTGLAGTVPGAKVTVPSTPAGIITLAGDTAAQSSLQAALSAVDEAAITAGGYGSIGVATLSSTGAAAFTSGASTSPATISVASSGGAAGGITLAARAPSGNCWLVWRSEVTTLYGIGRHMTSCLAPALSNTPTSQQGSASILWRPSAFPSK